MQGGGSRRRLAPPEVLASLPLAFSCPPSRILQAGGRAPPRLFSRRDPFTFTCVGRGGPPALAWLAFHCTFGFHSLPFASTCCWPGWTMALRTLVALCFALAYTFSLCCWPGAPIASITFRRLTFAFASPLTFIRWPGLPRAFRNIVSVPGHARISFGLRGRWPTRATISHGCSNTNSCGSTHEKAGEPKA